MWTPLQAKGGLILDLMANNTANGPIPRKFKKCLDNIHRHMEFLGLSWA